MSLMDKKFIDVLNYNDNVIVVPTTGGRSYKFNPGTTEDPFIYPIAPEDIRFINSNCNVFKNGTLRFHEDEAEEIYTELGIKNYDEMLFTEDIDDMLLNPTMDNMNKIINISDSGQFERVRGRYYYLINNDYSVEVKVGKIIDERYKELRDGKRHTNISLTPSKKASDEKRLEDMLKDYSAMKEQFNQLISILQSSGISLPDKNHDDKSVEEVSTVTPKKTKIGRPKKSSIPVDLSSDK